MTFLVIMLAVFGVFGALALLNRTASRRARRRAPRRRRTHWNPMSRTFVDGEHEAPDHDHGGHDSGGGWDSGGGDFGGGGGGGGDS
jgi:hypothetical protein